MGTLYSFGVFRLDAGERVLLRDDKAVHLTPKAFETLLVLVSQGGHVVRKEDLLNQVWPGTFVGEATLAQNISTLRKVLAEANCGIEYIQTVPKYGYRFAAPVRSVEDAPAALIVEKHVRARIVVQEEDNQDEAGTFAQRSAAGVCSVSDRISYPKFRRALAFGILFLAVVVSGGLVVRQLARSQRAIESVAVMPFVNLSHDPEIEYLADGITESLIGSLSQLPRLKVMSRNSVVRYKGREIESAAVGRDLGVEALLLGQVQSRADVLTISVELVDTHDRRRLWGEQYQRRYSDLLSLETDVVRELSAKLRPRVLSEEEQKVVRRGTESSDAYRLYLQGHFYWNELTETSLKQSIQSFRQALEKDPNYALAFAGLADAYQALGFYYLRPAEVMPKAKTYALKALQLNETLAEAHYSLGSVCYFYDWDWPAAAREAKRATELQPNSVLGHDLSGMFWRTLGRFQEADAAFRRGHEVDPMSHLINCDLGWNYYVARRYDEAIIQTRKTLEMDPTCPLDHLWLAQAYEQKGMWDKAIEDLQRARTSLGDPLPLIGELGYAYAASGKRAEGQKILEELRARGGQKYIDPYVQALIHFGLGDKDRGFALLEQAFIVRSIWLPLLKVEPKLDAVRSDSRFQAILRRMSLS